VAVYLEVTILFSSDYWMQILYVIFQVKFATLDGNIAIVVQDEFSQNWEILFNLKMSFGKWNVLCFVL